MSSILKIIPIKIKMTILIKYNKLKEFIASIYVKHGVPFGDASLQADAMVWANLRGIDSHGIIWISHYIKWIEERKIQVNPKTQVIRETSSTMTLDMGQALGAVGTSNAIERSINKAKKYGICWTNVSGISHQGAIGYYTRLAALKNMACIMFSCSSPNMTAYGARTAGLHNCPISIAIPSYETAPVVLDMATSKVTRGQILMAVEQDLAIPDNWALNQAGQRTTDPKQAAILLPMSGPKGSGLAFMLECLCKMMDQKVDHQSEVYGINNRNRTVFQNCVIIVINIDYFININRYKDQVSSMIKRIKTLTPADNFEEVLVPGEREEKIYAERLKRGIPIPTSVIESMRRIASQVSVDFAVDKLCV